MNENLKNILTSGLVALVVVALALAIYSPGTSTITERIKAQFVALTGPDIPYSYFSFGGVRHWAATLPSFNTATATPCALQSPFGTSTLISASARIDVASSSATTWGWYISADNFSTTTIVVPEISLAANAQGSLVASSSELQLFASEQFLVLGVKGGNSEGDAIGFLPQGRCTAEWLSI